MDLLEIKNITKSFNGKKVLDNISFSVKENTIFGFVGVNGAGKTTTMKLIVGLLKPDAGKISVCGQMVEYGQTKTSKYIGYLPDIPEYYGYMKPYEYLKLCGEICGIHVEDIKTRINDMLDMVGLAGCNKKISGFSRGMKQRLGIAQALLNKPKLLICDEPTSALDPIGRKEILDILKEAKKHTTVFFSTHILSDIEKICDEVAILNQGTIALNENITNIRHLYDSNKVRLAVDQTFSQFEGLKSKFSNLPFVTNVEIIENALLLDVKDMRKSKYELFSFIATEKISVLKFEVLEPTLENLFLEVVE